MIFNMIGGGAPLNFKIIGGTTQPTNPTENMIWVNTNTDITGWVFSATEPETPAEGFVWFGTAGISTVPFNALKKNGIQVYPVSAKQYFSGAWVEKVAQIYQGGQWVDWILTLYNQGYLNSDVTGSWQAVKAVENSEADTYGGIPSVAVNSDNVTISMPTSANYQGIAHLSKKIDLTPYSKLVFDGKMCAEWSWASIRIWSEIGWYFTDNQVAAYITGSKTGTPSLTVDGVVTIDVSGLSGEYYIGFALVGKSGSTYITIRELYLE